MWSMACSRLLSSPPQAAWVKKEPPSTNAMQTCSHTNKRNCRGNGRLRCHLRFAILCYAIMCIRGTGPHSITPQTNRTWPCIRWWLHHSPVRTASEDEGYSDNDATQKVTHNSFQQQYCTIREQCSVSRCVHSTAYMIRAYQNCRKILTTLCLYLNNTLDTTDPLTDHSNSPPPVFRLQLPLCKCPWSLGYTQKTDYFPHPWRPRTDCIRCPRERNTNSRLTVSCAHGCHTTHTTLLLWLRSSRLRWWATFPFAF